MLSKKKAQIALEYMILVGLGIVIVTVILTIIGVYFQFKVDEKNHDLLNDLAMSIQNELILASEVEVGYIRVLNIPQTLDSLEYDINNTNRTLSLNYPEGQGIILLIPITNGTLVKGDNIITNRGGVVRINT